MLQPQLPPLLLLHPPQMPLPRPNPSQPLPAPLRRPLLLLLPRQLLPLPPLQLLSPLLAATSHPYHCWPPLLLAWLQGAAQPLAALLLQQPGTARHPTHHLLLLLVLRHLAGRAWRVFECWCYVWEHPNGCVVQALTTACWG
jgi:hypothetical protein